jgi:hypothetical protein
MAVVSSGYAGDHEGRRYERFYAARVVRVRNGSARGVFDAPLAGLWGKGG